METIIPDYELIGNPKVLMDSDSVTNKLMPSDNLEPYVRSGNNRYSAQVPANNAQSSGPLFNPFTSHLPNYKIQDTIAYTQLCIDSDCPEAHGLRGWRNTASVSISKEIMPVGSNNEIRKTLSQIKDEGLGRSDKPDWITAKATLTFVRTDNFCYTASPLLIGDRQCKKKAKQSDNKRWFCERCNQEFEECDYRYLLQVQIQDHTGVISAIAFQESGEEILGCSAKELYLLKYELQDDPGFIEIIHGRIFQQYLFQLKIKEELYDDEQRVKITIVKVDEVNSFAESRYLLDSVTNNLPIKKQFCT